MTDVPQRQDYRHQYNCGDLALRMRRAKKFAHLCDAVEEHAQCDNVTVLCRVVLRAANCLTFEWKTCDCQAWAQAEHSIVAHAAEVLLEREEKREEKRQEEAHIV